MRGDTLASGEGSSKAIGIVRLWNIKTADSMCSLLEHSGTVWSIALGDEFAASASFDMTAKVWAAEMLRMVPRASPHSHIRIGSSRSAWKVIWLPLAAEIATCGSGRLQLCLPQNISAWSGLSVPGAVAVSNLISQFGSR